MSFGGNQASLNQLAKRYKIVFAVLVEPWMQVAGKALIETLQPLKQLLQLMDLVLDSLEGMLLNGHLNDSGSPWSYSSTKGTHSQANASSAWKQDIEESNAHS
jgi:hypothetical protein